MAFLALQAYGAYLRIYRQRLAAEDDDPHHRRAIQAVLPA